jgi:predicted ArsR family transcriptional regulator
MDLRKNGVVKSESADDASTRRRVFTAILQAGSVTAAQLAEDLALTPAAIRRHLDALSDDELIEAKEPLRRGPRGRGRPAKVFSLTDKGRESVHNSYDRLAMAAIDELIRTAGPAGLDRLANDYFGPISDEFRQAKSHDDQETDVQALVDALNRTGYVASVDDLPSGEQLCQHHCPVADVAKNYPQLCEIETGLISDLLKSHVQRLATIAHGDGVCTTHVPNPPGSAAKSNIPGLSQRPQPAQTGA